MKAALLKTLATVLIGALLFLLGWLLYQGGWEKLKEDWTKKYRPRPTPTRAPLALGPDGYYWGVTEESQVMPGYVYKMKPDGSGWKRIYTFLPVAAPTAGLHPEGGLVSDGVDSLLGVTSGNGREGRYGTLYKINAATGVLTTLVEFTSKSLSNKGLHPQAALVRDGKGFYWGSTLSGGTKNSGTIFKFHPPTGVLTTVVEMPPSLQPKRRMFGPDDALVSDGMGYWWGTTTRGGKEETGSVFKVNADTGELTTVVEFTEGKGGDHPMGGVVNDGLGYLWGTCAGGGQDHGTIYKVHAATGALTTVVEFTGDEGGNLGHFPEAALVSDGHGFHWGSTVNGGTNVAGTIFKVDITSGVLTTLVQFGIQQASHKGYLPQGTLVSDGHGAFLGTTSQGGKKDAGTIFKIDIATGVLTTLVELGKVGP